MALDNYNPIAAIEGAYAVRFNAADSHVDLFEVTPEEGTRLNHVPAGMFTDTAIYWIERIRSTEDGWSGTDDESNAYRGVYLGFHRGSSIVSQNTFLAGLSGEWSWVLINETTQEWIMWPAAPLSGQSGTGYANFNVIPSYIVDTSIDHALQVFALAQHFASGNTLTAALDFQNGLPGSELVVALIPNNSFRPFSAANNVDAGEITFAFVLPEPTAQRTRYRDAEDIAYTFDLPRPTVTHTLLRRVESLLPGGAAPLERALEAAIAPRVSPELIRQVWDPWTCPAKLLPWLAWAMSVDYWQDDWTEEQKRTVIAVSIEVHRRKGTPAAMRRVVESLGFGFDLVEWWDQTPEGTPGTAEAFIFRASAGRFAAVEDLGLIRRLLADVKRGTLHLRVTPAAQVSTQAYLYAHADAHKYQSFSYTVNRVQFAGASTTQLYLYARADAYEHQEFSYEVGR